MANENLNFHCARCLQSELPDFIDEPFNEIPTHEDLLPDTEDDLTQLGSLKGL